MQPETMDDDGDPVGIIRESEEIEATLPSNEYVLNVAFFSFMVFVLFQAIFALIAHSESMLADSEAMSVDALTYLFNLCAERLKHRPLTSSELSMPVERRCYQRELRRLYLELIPPTASVATLVFVTFITLREALATLRAEGDVNHEDEDVSIPIMLYFSAANLLLDVVNVTCFARAHSTFGLDVVRQESTAIKEGILSARYSHERLRIDERSRLLPSGGSMESELTNLQRHETSVPRGHLDLVNLNMCSAWTVSF